MSVPTTGWLPLGVSPPEPCPYLADRAARLECGLVVDPAPDELDLLLERGFRRLGTVFFRPSCEGCRECVSLRVPADRFVPSKSQRRVLRRGADVTLEWREPHFDPAHLALYRAHLERVTGKPDDTSEETYRQLLVSTCVDTRMGIYRVGDELLGLSVLDVGPRSASSVYFCWDARFGALCPGTLSALREIHWCADQGIRYYYLGYRVAGCPSTTYKSRFAPYELLDWEDERWA